MVLSPGPVEHRAGAGQHAAAEQRGPVERDPAIDADGLAFGDDGPLSEHRRVRERVRRLSPPHEPRGGIDVPVHAEGWPSLGARRAAAAGREGDQHDMVAWGNSGDGRAGPLHHARALVAEDDRPRGTDGALHQAEVTAAHACRLDAHLDVGRPERAELDVIHDLNRVGEQCRPHAIGHFARACRARSRRHPAAAPPSPAVSAGTVCIGHPKFAVTTTELEY